MSEKKLRLFVWLLFILIIAYIKVAHHELWKDEWQAWFVAKDKSISEVLSFLYYEGHPALWYLYLKIFTLFSGISSPEMLINIAHWVIVAGGLFILFCRLRIPLIICILGALSYFLFFEYGIINRGYALMILLSFWSAMLISQRDYNSRQLAIILFLLCQTEVYGVFIAISLGMWLLIGKEEIIKSLKSPAIFGLGLGLLFFVISVFPRTTGHVAKTRGKELSFVDNILTSFQGNLSNTYLIGSTSDTFAYGWSAAGMIFSLLALAGLIFVFYGHKKLLVPFLTFLVMMLTFSIFFFTGGIRQWGAGFVFLFVLLGLRGIELQKDKIAGAIIVIFCIFGVIHNIKAVREEIRLPFTNAEVTGRFIREKVPSKVPVVAINKFETTPVIGYAGRKFYELPDGVQFSYFRWVDKVYLPTETELKLFAQFKGVGGIVIISPKPLDADRFPSAKLWQKFDEENYKKENYYLYSMAR
jgi:hypothetical protein